MRVSSYMEPGAPLEDRTKEWFVYRFDLIERKFGFSECDLLPAWHAAIAPLGRPWRIVRLLYGVNPQLSIVRHDSDVARFHTQAQVATILGISLAAVRKDLAVALEAWRKAEPTALSTDPEDDTSRCYGRYR